MQESQNSIICLNITKSMPQKMFFFFFQNVLGNIHFQLLSENFYIEIKNSSNKFYIHIQNVSLCEYYLIKEWWSYKVHVANTCHTSFLLKKMRYNERAGREKRAKKERKRWNKKTWYEAKFVSFSSPWSIRRWDIRLVFTLQMEFSGGRKFAGLRSIVNSCHPPFVSFKTHPRLD